MLMSVRDESVDISFVLDDNGKSLSDEFVSDRNHGEFTGLSVLPEPRVSLFALCIESAGSPCGHIEKTSSVCISVSIDVPSDVYGSSGQLVSMTDTEIAGHLLGILEIGEASCQFSKFEM